MKPLLLLFVFVVISQKCESFNVTVVYCAQPDYPLRGEYTPKKDLYDVGSLVYYYCYNYNLMSGNHIRRCEDNGDWSGDTPVCDQSQDFMLTNQTSTVKPEEDNASGRAVGYRRRDCSQTLSGPGQYWMGIFKETEKLLSVAIFMPHGYAAYQVIALKKDGSQLSCGTKIGEIENLDWDIHICPEPNTDVIGIKIRSLSDTNPLKLCKIRPYVTKTPVCTDPHLRIPNGRLEIERTHAELRCKDGYELGYQPAILVSRSDPYRITCIREGVWNKKNLYCIKKKTEEEIIQK